MNKGKKLVKNICKAMGHEYGPREDLCSRCGEFGIQSLLARKIKMQHYLYKDPEILKNQILFELGKLEGMGLITGYRKLQVFPSSGGIHVNVTVDIRRAGEINWTSFGCVD
jgi:hypothetical protein